MPHVEPADEPANRHIAHELNYPAHAHQKPPAEQCKYMQSPLRMHSGPLKWSWFWSDKTAEPRTEQYIIIVCRSNQWIFNSLTERWFWIARIVSAIGLAIDTTLTLAQRSLLKGIESV